MISFEEAVEKTMELIVPLPGETVPLDESPGRILFEAEGVPLALAQEAGVDFSMKDIDSLSRRIPNICKVAPSSHFHVQDVNRAGGILSIMGELDRVGLMETLWKTVRMMPSI